MVTKSSKNNHNGICPTNNFQLIGEIKNSICPEAVVLSNEKGIYKNNKHIINFNYPFWHPNNFGLISWIFIEAYHSDMKVSNAAFMFDI